LQDNSGEKIWSYKTGADVESFTSVANGVVYIGSNDNYVYAFGSITVPQPSPTIPEINPNIIFLAIMALTATLIFSVKNTRSRTKRLIAPHYSVVIDN
jgi:hypothetical protein